MGKTESRPTLSHSVSREEDKMQVQQSEKKKRKSIENTQIMKESVVKAKSEDKPEEAEPAEIIQSDVGAAEKSPEDEKPSTTEDVNNTKPLKVPEVQKDKADSKKETKATKKDEKTKAATLEADSK